MASEAKKEAAASEAKTGEGDPSMEEILQSIRKIIADDEGGAKAADSSEVQGSSVLELTEMIKDDGSIVSLKADAAPVDVLNQIDQALATEKPAAAEPEKAPAPAAEKPVETKIEKPVEKPAEPAAAPAPAPVAAAEPKAAAPAPATPAPVSDDALISSAAASAAAESFRKLKSAEPELPPATTTPAPNFRSGVTMEDMVADMLRPLLKAWLDANLPTIVERIVEREVRKLTK